jgi:beta-lactam-binding protein with PASTA domain
MVTGKVPPDALERRAYFEGKKKDILKPIDRYTKEITDNQETAILNALNIRIENRTQDMTTLANELTTMKPQKVKRLYGKIKGPDILRWPLWAKIVAPTGLLALATFSVLFFMGIIGFNAQLPTGTNPPDGMTRVPSIINNDISQAEEQLNEATLLLSIIGRDYSNEIPPNLILNQSITGGSVVALNTFVNVVISAEQQDIVLGMMPDVQFMTKDEAIQFISEAGLNFEILYDYSETISEGLVISQSPDAGTDMDLNDIVSITVSTGLPPFEMLDIVGLNENEARSTLIAAGLSLSINYERSGQVPDGTVLSQSIPPGMAVRRGAFVVITIASGGDLIPLPYVFGMLESEAVEILNDLGFEVILNESESETVDTGYVISITPEAGTYQLRGTQVFVTISSGPPTETTTAQPPVTTQGTIPTPTSTPSPTPTPTPTPSPTLTPTPTPSPAPTPAVTVQVANVVGLTQQQAINTLQNQGFEVVVGWEPSDTVPNGIVISQTPPEARNSITIVVSRGREYVVGGVTFSHLYTGWDDASDNYDRFYVHFVYQTTIPQESRGDYDIHSGVSLFNRAGEEMYWLSGGGRGWGWLYVGWSLYWTFYRTNEDARLSERYGSDWRTTQRINNGWVWRASTGGGWMGSTRLNQLIPGETYTWIAFVEIDGVRHESQVQSFVFTKQGTRFQ